jgi:hypothetical protein
VRATYHTALMASLGQVIFGRDMMFPTRYVVNWKLIHDKKTQKMQEDNRQENASRLAHDYKVGDVVLIRRDGRDGDIIRKMSKPSIGPFRIMRVFTNGTVKIQRCRFQETIHIRRLIPYHRRPH